MHCPRVLTRLLLLCTLGPAVAHAQMYAIYKQFPAEAMKARFYLPPPDARGYVWHQKELDRIHDPEWQRGGPFLLIYGVVNNVPQAIDQGFTIIDATFREQNPNGCIGDINGYTETGNVLFISDVLRAFLILGESPLKGSYWDRVEKDRPNIQRMVNWLMAPPQIVNLNRQNSKAPNRALSVAVMFARANRFLGKTPWTSLSQQFYDLAMASYDPSTGVFIEGGGADSSYQAVNLLVLEFLSIEFGRKEILDPFKHGFNWELTKIGQDGKVSVTGNSRTGLGQEKVLGRPKDVNYGEVMEMFYLACFGMNESRGCDAGSRCYVQWQNPGKK